VQASGDGMSAAAASDNVPLQLRLGQRVILMPSGMHGAVVGWDRSCCESSEWQEHHGIADLTKVRNAV
jgi:Hemimethylated DNA-binding protein YccV like